MLSWNQFILNVHVYSNYISSDFIWSLLVVSSSSFYKNWCFIHKRNLWLVIFYVEGSPFRKFILCTDLSISLKYLLILLPLLFFAFWMLRAAFFFFFNYEKNSLTCFHCHFALIFEPQLWQNKSLFFSAFSFVLNSRQRLCFWIDLF